MGRQGRQAGPHHRLAGVPLSRGPPAGVVSGGILELALEGRLLPTE